MAGDIITGLILFMVIGTIILGWGALIFGPFIETNEKKYDFETMSKIIEESRERRYQASTEKLEIAVIDEIVKKYMSTTHTKTKEEKEEIFKKYYFKHMSHSIDAVESFRRMLLIMESSDSWRLKDACRELRYLSMRIALKHPPRPRYKDYQLNINKETKPKDNGTTRRK